MASASVALTFLLSRLTLSLILCSSHEHDIKTCPSSFNCGALGELGYPFTTIFNPTCGIFVINCTATTQFIGLSAKGPWYKVLHSFSSNTTFHIGDESLQYAVEDDSCDSFKKNSFNIPKSSAVTCTILYSETFWKCDKKFNDSGNFRRLLDCPGYNIYQTNYSGNSSRSLSKCKNFFYPRFLILDLTHQCSQCISEGGYCHEPKNGVFQCINKQKAFAERRKRMLLLGSCISGGSIMIIVLGLLLFYCWKKMKLRSIGFDSENISKQIMRTKTNVEGSKVYFSVPVFSYSELEEATNNFDPTRELGDGGFGTVYYGILKDGREVAIKRLYERNYRQLEQYMNEIEILATLRHQNLVNLYGCTSRRSKELLLVYEYLPNATVSDHLIGDQAICGTLTWSIRMKIAIETATALSYLHASDVIHRDVKTKNILLDNNFCVKVADFGLSRLFPVDVTHISTAPQGTPGYLDPEYHQCYQLTDKSDVYSFGVVLVELISSLPPVDIKCRKGDEVNLSYFAMKRIQCCAFEELVDRRLRYDENYKVKRMITLVAELAFQCLQHKKEYRPSMAEVLDTLKRIDSADYEVHKAEEKEKENEKEENDVWLLRNNNTQDPCSPNSVMYKWDSSKGTY